MNKNLSQALNFHKKGKFNEAENIYLNLIKKNKKNFSALQLLGTLYLQKSEYNLAEKFLIKSLEIDPKNPNVINNLGILKKKKNNLDEALNYFNKNIIINNFLNSWVNKSNILLDNKNYKEGLDFTKQALIAYPNNLKLKNNLALFLFENGLKEKAFKVFDELLLAKTKFTDPYINYSNILRQHNNLPKALEIINKLIIFDGSNVQAVRLRSIIYKQIFEFKKAEKDLLNIIKIEQSNVLFKKDLVDLYIDSKNFQKAIKFCDEVIDNGCNDNFFFVKKTFSKINAGDWLNLKKDIKLINKNLDFTNILLDPLSIKYFNDDPFYQKKIAEVFWENKINQENFSFILGDIKKKKDNSKVKIGYFSADFNNHAVFQLIQDLFVYHDKSKFEIYAYSLFKKTDSAREKIKRNVKKFYDIDNLSNDKIIELIKNDDLDIAIDLTGYTKNNKSNIFNFNIAKLKINYLGYPGTMGTDKYDYIIADQNIIPKEHFDFYSEKVIYMPETYQPFSPIPFDFKIDRSEFNLPKNKLILGCFSRIEKILPNVFDIWMRIIDKHKDAYLAMCIKNSFIKENIKNYCEKNKFDYTRIIFLDPIEHKNNLRRMATFDLYLDSFPYNGHTGISDSLFQSCLPTISLTGNSFASRVSFSLLYSINLNELITKNEEDYFNKIDYYCSNRAKLKKIKENLISIKNNNFDRMKKFTKDFENLISSLIIKNK